MVLPQGFLDELRARVSISSVAGRKVTWDSRKTNAARGDFWAPCPFHQEKTASFHVEESKGRYHCFGCHAGGDVVSFVRETENLGFMEAVERLAAEAGMTMPARDPAEAARTAAAAGLVEAMEAAVRFYRAQLNGARAMEARAYLERRGLSATTIEQFEIGFAPEARTDLLGHLTNRGFSRDVLVEAGLVGLPRDGGSAYDRFRGRIMFPIRDARGRAIAFGARALRADQEPKYLNSPETPLFDKSRTLYNIGPARAAAGRTGTLIVTEGYMDVIALAQAGLGHAVAPLGTAVTETQLALLWKIAPEPVVALDGDAAGLAAAHRVIDRVLPLLGPGQSLRFAILPPGQDPDDVVRTDGAAAMEAILAASQPVIALLWTRETEGQVLDSPERRAALDQRLRAHLARITDEGLRGHWQAEIRNRRAALFAPATPAVLPGAPFPPGPRGPARRGRRGGAGPSVPVITSPTPATRASYLVREPQADEAGARLRECAILAGCLHHPTVARALEDRLERLPFACADLSAVRDALVGCLESDAETDSVGIVGRVASRLGHDPLPQLSVHGHVQANPHLGPAAPLEMARRAIEEAMARHEALTGRAAEIEEARQDFFSASDEALTQRIRAAADAELEANCRPLEDDPTGDDSERREFAAVMEAAAASPARRPRRP